MTVSGRIMATSSSRARNRPQAVATAALTAALFTMLTSTAEETLGKASSQRAARRAHANWKIPWRNVAALLNESHLVNLFYSGDARANLGQPAFAQRSHALFAGYALNL